MRGPPRPFTDMVATEAELREIMGAPGALAVGKQFDRLDRHCRDFIALSPFVLVGTYNAAGRSDVSPRGDEPGFVDVLDDKTLAVPERSGNRRLDSLLNVLETGAIGLLFLVPGFEETLRVNGRARVIRDADVLGRTAAQGKRPLVAIGVEVEECFLHCAKAFKRSNLWRADGRSARSCRHWGGCSATRGPRRALPRRSWTAGSRKATRSASTEERFGLGEESGTRPQRSIGNALVVSACLRRAPDRGCWVGEWSRSQALSRKRGGLRLHG